MLARVSLNVIMTIFPFYLEEVTSFRSSSEEPTSKALALVPLVFFASQTFFTVTLNSRFNQYVTTKESQMFLVTLLSIVSSLPMALLSAHNSQLIYLLSALQGISLIIFLNTATTLISSLIGHDTENSAFVYGIYSFLDKLANGTILFILVRDYSHN